VAIRTWCKIKEFIKKVIQSLKAVYRNDEARFRLSTTLKITLIPLVTIMIMWSFILIILRMDLLFFDAHDMSDIALFKETYYQFVITTTIDQWHLVGSMLIILVFVGIYISNLFLRPFGLIKKYCENFVEGNTTSYDPDFFTDLKLLTSFSEYFFNYMENVCKSGKLEKAIIPDKYGRIHSPVFEKDFFIQFSFLIILTSIIMTVFLNNAAVNIHDGIINLAHQTLNTTNLIKYYLEKQTYIIDDILIWVNVVHIILYFCLAIHLYGKISAPAFGIFATMRAFIKGQYKQRVHLIGYYYLRPHCRSINKYLDYIEKNYKVND
jgi:hypothetical protein